MTLIARFDAASDKARHVHVLRTATQEASRFQKRHNQLAEWAQQLEPLVDAHGVLTAAQRPLAKVQGISETIARLRTTRTAFQGEHASILTTNLAELSDRISGHTTALRTRLLTAWGAYVDELAPEPDASTLALIRTLTPLREVSRALDAVLERRTVLRNRLPSSEADVAAAQAIGTEIRAVWKEAGLSDLDEEVRTFLREAGSGTATLAHLTAPVYAWLEEHVLAGRIRLRFA